MAADWLVANQNSMGGWPTNVTRRIYATVQIAPGWNSAMAQGDIIFENNLITSGIISILMVLY